MGNLGIVRLSLECDVIDLTALWNTAADVAAADFAMTPDDVIETIGPPEDPEIEACVSMVIDRIARHSGIVNSIAITAVVVPDENAIAAEQLVPATEPPVCSGDRQWTRAIHAASLRDVRVEHPTAAS